MWGRAISGAGEVLGDSQNAGGGIWDWESARAGEEETVADVGGSHHPVGWCEKERNKTGAKRPFF